MASRKATLLLVLGLAVVIGVVGYMAVTSTSYASVAKAAKVCSTRLGASLVLEVKNGEVESVTRIDNDVYEMLLVSLETGEKLYLVARGEQARQIIGSIPLTLKVGDTMYHVTVPGKGKAVVEVRCSTSKNGVPVAVVVRVLESCHESYSAPVAG
ncbi:MAG TPA: hypothetical protein EYH08_04690 [Pyrodictium sp.]|nr:hypothetical protein [Pyrodictium sp.]